MEIEKKYQIKEMPCLDGAMTKEMEQGYLCTDPVVRIRRSNDKYILTCKSFDGMIGERRADVRMCQEYEINLSEESYKHLRQKVDGGLISKTRYIIPLADGHIAELDVFHGPLEGLRFVEVEFQDTYFQDICDQKKEPVIHYTNTGSGYMVMDHLNDFQKDLPETAYLTADVILIQPLHDYEAMMVSTLSDKCRKDAKIYSLGTIYTRYRNYCKFKNDFSKPLAGFTPGGDLCDDLVQRKILKHYDIQSMDEVHPTYLNGFISGASIYKELFHGKILDIDYKKMSYALDSFIPGKTDKEREEKMKEILDAAQKFDVKEYQKSGRGYYGYSEKIKRGA